jgi:hypothetical protein
MYCNVFDCLRFDDSRMLQLELADFQKDLQNFSQILNEVLSNLSGKLVVFSTVGSLAAHSSYRDASLCS